MASTYVFIHQIFSDGRLILSDNNTVERTEMVSLTDIDRITRAEGVERVGMYLLRLKEGREEQQPWAGWIARYAAKIMPVGLTPHESKAVALKSSIEAQEWYDKGRITMEERDRFMQLFGE